MMLALAQIIAAMMTTRTTTKQAVSAAHIILRCHGVGYSFLSEVEFKFRMSDRCSAYLEAVRRRSILAFDILFGCIR